MSKLRPFQDFYLAEDICKCNNKQCKQKYNCFRFMGKSTDWQSMTTFEGGKNCENFMPFYVWKTGDDKSLMLKDITDDHLKNIIIHLFERSHNTNYIRERDTKLALEFIKEARRRKIYA